LQNKIRTFYHLLNILLFVFNQKESVGSCEETNAFILHFILNCIQAKEK